MKTRILFFCTALLVVACGGRAGQPISPRTDANVQTVATPGDSTTSRLFRQVMSFARQDRLSDKSLGEIMVAVGLQFRGKPYMAGLLDQNEQESLVCRLDGFDCVTFVETTLALARGIKNQDYSYDTFNKYLQDQRYRGGTMNGYCSRLHYFSDWIQDNERRGTVRNITTDLGGLPLPKSLNFMSSHRDSYPRLVSDDAVYSCIVDAEKQLQDLELVYVPKSQVRSVYDQLQSGDIIAITTGIEGLDVTHTGLVFKENGRVGFLHASTTGGVKISPDLQQYLSENKKQTGIIVTRPGSTS